MSETRENNVAEQAYKEMQRLYASGKKPEAIETGIAYLYYGPIRAFLMKIYMDFAEIERKEQTLREGYYVGKAYDWGTDPLFANDEDVQSQLMRMHIFENEYDKAIEIGTREEFKSKKLVQKRLIDAYIAKGMLKEAEDIFERFREPSNKIHTNLIRKYSEQGFFERAEELASEDRFWKDQSINSELISMYIKQGRYEDAIKTAEKKENGTSVFEEDKYIQSKRIEAYYQLHRYDEALEICEQFPDDPVIQNQAIKILGLRIETGKIQAIMKRFPHNLSIQRTGDNKINGYYDPVVLLDIIENKRTEEQYIIQMILRQPEIVGTVLTAAYFDNRCMKEKIDATIKHISSKICGEGEDTQIYRRIIKQLESGVYNSNKYKGIISDIKSMEKVVMPDTEELDIE